MSYRTAQIFIQYRTLSRLRSAVKLYPRGVVDSEAQRMTQETADERADRLLNEAIDREYPDVVEMEKELNQIEKKYMEQKKGSK